MTQRAFVPAAGHDHWLRFYDPLTRLLGAPAALRKLVDLADLRAAQRVLDIGCGTGTLAIMVKQRFPQVHITALDPDQGALDRARRKAERARVDIDFVRGFADSLPCPNASFDRVLSSFMLHHLTHDEQQATLADVFRALKAGGSLHILDFAGHEDRKSVV